MKILIVPDVPNWAIGRLCGVIAMNNRHHKIETFYMGPRDVMEKYADFKKKVEEFQPDIIQYDYFRTAGQLFDLDPHLTKIPSIVVHHNQREKALYQYDFFAKGVKHIVVHNDRGLEILAKKGWDKNVSKIQLGIDPKYWHYKDEEPEEFIIGSAGRICSWKNEKLIINAAAELNLPVMHMGKMDEPDYWNSIEHKEVVRYDYWECTDSVRPSFYNNISVYVGASDDSRETGTLELLEAMASGTPVITTLSGVAAEICKDGVNCLVVPFNDQNAIKEAIIRIRDDAELRKSLRKEAWQTVKGMTEQKYAMQFEKLWYSLVRADFPLVSVVIPTYNRSKQLSEVLNYFQNEEDYPNFEVVIVDDNSNDDTHEFFIDYRQDAHYPIKYINTKADGYNLALARNLGVIESVGEIVVFCDSRLKPEAGALYSFVEAVQNAGKVTEGGNKKVWFFGDKGSQKKSFVENFSAVKRSEIIEAGMFNERINKYGGMSQELRARWMKQGGEFYYLDSAKAVELTKSGMSTERRNDIVDMKMLLYKLYGDQRY